MDESTCPGQPSHCSRSVPAGPPPQAPGAAILVSKRQQGNPLLKHIKQVRWQYADIVPDYMVGATTALLFLSIRCAVALRARAAWLLAGLGCLLRQRQAAWRTPLPLHAAAMHAL